jgi:hypothetical protein
MHDRIVRGVFNISANNESSVEALYFLEPGTRNIRFGRLISEAVQGIRRNGALLSSGAISPRLIESKTVAEPSILIQIVEDKRKSGNVQRPGDETFTC